MEEIIRQLQTLDPLLVYGILFSIAFLENIFPPSPSDMVIVFGGTLVGIGHVGFVEALLSSTLGSTLGFMAMYAIGEWFGVKILEQGKIKFIPLDAVRKVEGWFSRYGYWIIIANRFLSGTRAVVSFFAGMSKLTLLRTTVLCFLSACAWNCILLTGGYSLGQNWQRLGFYLTTYSEIVSAIIIFVALGLAARYFYVKRNGRGKG